MRGRVLRGADLAEALVGRPRLMLRLCALAILLLTLGSIALMLSIPLASVDAEMGADGTVELVAPHGRWAVPGRTAVRFVSAETAGIVALPAELLPGVAEPRATAEENGRYWRGRDRLAAMLAAAPVRIEAGGRSVVAVVRSRTLSDLTIGFWLSMVAGAAAGLAGLWVWVLRPTVWAPAMFGLSGIGLFVGCVTTALNISPGLGMSGSLDRALLVINYASGLLCAGSLVALFARFPRPILPVAALWPLAIVSIAIGAIVLTDALPNAVDVAILMVIGDSAAFIALLAWQAWLTRSDRAQRRALVPVAIGAVVPTILFSLLSMIGQIDGGRPLVMPDMSAPLLLMIYLGLGIAVARSQLFSLGRWSVALLLSTGTIILFVLIDAVLLSTVTRQPDLAFFLSAMMVALVYLPAREWLLQRADRIRSGRTRDLLQAAADVALAPPASRARDAWLDALGAIFDSFEAEPAADDAPRPELRDQGATLYVPSPEADHAVLLRYPAHGGRSFDADDVEVAELFGHLVSRLIQSRDAYLRGVAEERDRIARDLHDDVSARLLTSLHRSDTRLMQDDVRGAMADIRTIVTGLSGVPQSVDALLASLRHETQGRLEAAGIMLDWPLEETADAAIHLDYAKYRHLLSIVRECVSNVIRHSGATAVRVRVRCRDRMSVVIEDNGVGIGPSGRQGHGILNAERRAAATGGRLGVEGYPGLTRVRLELPL